MQSQHAQHEQQQTCRHDKQHLRNERPEQTLPSAQFPMHVPEHEWIIFHARIAITSALRMSNSV